MKNQKIIFYIFILLCISNQMFANTIKKPSAYQGRNFALAFIQNEIPRNDMNNVHFSIFVSSTNTTAPDTITVSIPYSSSYRIILTPNQIREIKLSKDQIQNIEVTKTGILKDKFIYIKSNNPITCWVFSSKDQSSDSYVAFPISFWGNEYRVITMPNDSYNGKSRQILDGARDLDGNVRDNSKLIENLTPRSGEFLVMSNYNNTLVTYIPKANTKNGDKKGVETTVKLNAGEVLLVQSAAIDTGDVGVEDLTGTLIYSNNPIGVISGHVRTAITQGLDYPFDTKDHIVEMLIPTKAWGKKFISVPFVNGRSTKASFSFLCADGDLMRIITKENNTTIKYSVSKKAGSAFEVFDTLIRNAGDCFEYITPYPVIWEANKPIMVSQLMMHTGSDKDHFFYDPSLVILPAIEQFIEEVTFSTPSNQNVFEQYQAHCVTIITNSVGIKNLVMDSQWLDQQNTEVWHQQIGNSDYYWTMLALKEGNHKLITYNNEKFSGILYGHGQWDSYAHILGSRLNDPFNIDSIAPIVQIKDTCNNLNIRVTDIINDDTNATGIDWGYIKKNVNYQVSNFVITDTSTVINFSAKPINLKEDAFIEFEFIDKNMNIITQSYTYQGFKIECPNVYDFQKMNLYNPTQAILRIKNNGEKTQKLLYITTPSDDRLEVSLVDTLLSPLNLPISIAQDEVVELVLTFSPNLITSPLNTNIKLLFECDINLDIAIYGEISAPGLIANNLEFNKVRLNDSKTLSGKIINAGNIAIIIDTIIIDDSELSNQEKNIFNCIFPTTFPIKLEINKSIDYLVLFAPAELKNYKINVTVNNDSKVDCNFDITGEGAIPNIKDLTLDFGKRRIGLQYDTIVYLVNDGGFNDTVRYFKNISISHPQDKTMETLNNFNKIVSEEGHAGVNFSYFPNDTIPMENTVELVSSWKQHQPISATVKAHGTIPIIKSNNYDFTKVPMYSTTTALHNIVQSLGNEALTIDAIIPISGDISAFSIDYNSLKNKIIEPNEDLICPITFKPANIGTYRMFLEITNDANPAHRRSKDTVEIIGNCVIENADVEFEFNLAEIYSCQTTQAILSIKNNSNGKIIIDSILLQYDSGIFSTKFVDDIKNFLPKEVYPTEILNIPVELYAEKGKNGLLCIQVYYNGYKDNPLKTLNIPIFPIVPAIKSEIILNANSISPSEKINVLCQAEINKKSEKFFYLDIKLYIDKKNFHLLDEIINIKFITNFQEKTLSASISQLDDYIKFNIPDINFQIDDATKIEFDINFLTLLLQEQNKQTQIGFEIISNRCYDSDISLLNIEIQKVCAEDIRILDFDGFPYTIITHNTNENNIDYTLNIIEKDIVSIIVTDLLGNIFIEKLDLNLEKGKYNFIFELPTIANSTYFITTKSNQLNVTKKIIVVK